MYNFILPSFAVKFLKAERGQGRAQHKRQQGFSLESSASEASQYPQCNCNSPISNIQRCASGTLLWLFCESFFFFFLKKRAREREREKKISHCQSRIQQTEQSQHSCLEKNVGLKAWSCLTCIISPSTHPSITVLSV